LINITTHQLLHVTRIICLSSGSIQLYQTVAYSRAVEIFSMCNSDVADQVVH